VSRPAGGAPGPADAARRKRAGPWRIAFFGLLILAVASGAAWVLLGSRLLVVRHVVVLGNHMVSAAQVRRAAAVRAGQPLATVNTVAAADRVDRIAQVLSARVTRSWPSTIVIAVRERTPALAVAAVGRGYLIIDEYGVTVAVTAREPAGLPLLTSPPEVLRGNPAVRAAAIVLRQLPAGLRRQVKSVSALSAATVTLQLTGGITVEWGSPGLASRKAAELALLMGTHARYFDVSDPDTVVTQG